MSIPGFASAERAYENMEPPEDECTCPQLFMCRACDTYADEAGACTDAGCLAEAPGRDADEAALAFCTEIDREDSTHNADRSCPVHGWCGGCTSRYCEECAG